MYLGTLGIQHFPIFMVVKSEGLRKYRDIQQWMLKAIDKVGI